MTRNRAGSGRSYYVATTLAPEGLGELLTIVCADAGVQPLVPDLPDDVEVARRSKDGTDWTFCINHGARDVRLPLEGVDLITGDGPRRRTGPRGRRRRRRPFACRPTGRHPRRKPA